MPHSSWSLELGSSVALLHRWVSGPFLLLRAQAPGVLYLLCHQAFRCNSPQGEGQKSPWLSTSIFCPFQFCRSCWLSQFPPLSSPTTLRAPLLLWDPSHSVLQEIMPRGLHKIWGETRTSPTDNSTPVWASPLEWEEGNIQKEYTYIEGVTFSWHLRKALTQC